LEAMNYGNCCLASDIPENVEVLEDHGYLFRNRDPADLQRALSELIEDPGKIALKKELAKEHVGRTYSWDRVADEMEALYFSVIQPKSH